MDQDRLLIEAYCGPYDKIDKKFSAVVSRVRKEDPHLLDAMEWEILRQHSQHQADTLDQQVRRRWSMAKYAGVAVLALAMSKGPIDAPKPAPILFDQTPCSDIYPCAGSYSSPRNFDPLDESYHTKEREIRELPSDRDSMP
jgi:hypothetical protein